MNLHKIALAAFKRLKNAPYVGRGVRYVVNRLKITFASWHYSNNRLAVAVSASTGIPGPAGEGIVPDAVQALSRKLALAEAAGRADTRPGHGLGLLVVDGDGLETLLEWRRGTDLSHMIPFPGARSLAIVSGMPSHADVAGLGRMVREGGSLVVTVPDVVMIVRGAGSPDEARAALGAACPAGWVNPDGIASSMAELGFTGVRTDIGDGTVDVSGTRSA